MPDVVDPWEKARTRYLERLDPDEAVLFKEASSKTRNAIAAIQPLVDKIEEYGKAMDTFANIAPTFLAPVWGALRVVLVLAGGFGKFYERMTDTLGRIGDILPRLFDYQRIFSHNKHPRLTESLANTYLDIIELCMEFRGLIKAQQKNVLKRVMQPLSSSFEQKFKDAEARFRAHEKTVEKEAETCHMIETAEERAVALRDRQLQEMKNKSEARKKLFRLLSVTGSDQKHAKVRGMRHQDTGSWLFATAEYKTWYNLKSSAVLRCYGIPGCGKTILASSVIDSLLTASKPDRSPIGYHYCDYADKRTLEPTTILGTLVRTLLEGIEIPSSIAELICEYYRDGERAPEMNYVLEILSKTINLFENVVLVIDGIDEAKEGDCHSIYEALKWLTRGHHEPIKVFMSCREDTELTLCSIPGLSFRIQVSEKVISTDIDGYIRYSVASLIERGDLAIRKPELQKDIVNALSKESDDAIKTTLCNLPKDLGETYNRLLGRIVGAERQELVKRMFRWIICARRPLHVDELCEGIAFTIDDRYWNEDKIPTDILRLVRACGNLVVIEEESWTVQLAHYTVQQYILNDQSSAGKFFHFKQAEADEILGEVCVAYLNFSDFETQVAVYVDNNVTASMATMEKVFSNVELAIPNKDSFGAMRFLAHMAHHQTKDTNIDYNRHVTKKAKPVEHLLNKYRLLSYIRENWLWHTAKFLPNGIGKTRRDTLFQELVSHKHLPFPFRPWNAITNNQTKYPYLEPLGWALITNHCPLIDILLQTDPTFNPCTYFEDAGRWFFEDLTSSHISEDMLKRIEHCAQDSWDRDSIAAEGWLYSQMLNACRRGNLDILERCLSAWISDSVEVVKTTPRLHVLGYLVIEAAASDKRLIIDWVLQWDVPDLLFMLKSFTVFFAESTCNALERAALAGHVDMVHYLRQQGWGGRELWSSNVQARIQRLNQAVGVGDAKVVEALFEAWKIFQNSYGCHKVEEAKLNTLVNAASLGHVSIVDICLKHGLDPLKVDMRGKCAYIEAILKGKHEVARYLISTNAGCGARPRIEGLPLSLAASSGNVPTAEILVSEGATASGLNFMNDSASSIQLSPTPLYVAAANGHESMVSYLLSLDPRVDSPSPTGLLSYQLKANASHPTRRRLFLSDRLPRDITSKIDVPLWQRPLIGAVMNGHAKVVELLLRSGADVNAREFDWKFTGPFVSLDTAAAMEDTSSRGYTPLLMACECGVLSVVKVLLQAGADPNCRDLPATPHNRQRGDIQTESNMNNLNGTTPLMIAVTKWKGGIIPELLRAGADKEATDKYGRTALLRAVMLGNKKAVAALIDGGASPRAKDSAGRGLLEVAVENRSFYFVEYLLGLHDSAMKETPPRFLFTSRDIGEAIRRAMNDDYWIMLTKPLQSLSRYFLEAMEFRIKHRVAPLLDVTMLRVKGVVTSPEDEEPHDLKMSARCDNGFTVWIPNLDSGGNDVGDDTERSSC